jgi:hypothetical protein
VSADDQQAAIDQLFGRGRAAQEAVNELGAGPPELPRGLPVTATPIEDAPAVEVLVVLALVKSFLEREAGSRTTYVETSDGPVCALLVERTDGNPVIVTVSRP